MNIVYRVERYDYFRGGSEEVYYELPLIDGWKAYTKSRQYDRDYGDSYQYTTISHTLIIPTEDRRQREHARTHKQWLTYLRMREMFISELRSEHISEHIIKYVLDMRVKDMQQLLDNHGAYYSYGNVWFTIQPTLDTLVQHCPTVSCDGDEYFNIVEPISVDEIDMMECEYFFDDLEDDLLF